MKSRARRTEPTVALWLFGMIAFLIAFSYTYWGFIRTVTGQTADEAALVAALRYLGDDAAQQSARALLDRVVLASGVLAALAVVTSAVRRRSLAGPAIAVASGLGAVASKQLLKHVFLTRPNLGISQATVQSFPSGHTTLVTAAMVVVMLVASPRLRPHVALLGGLFAAAVGAATYALAWHRPADIVGAYLVAGFWGLLGGITLLRREPASNAWTPGRGAPSRVVLALAWAPGLAGAAAAASIWFGALRYVVEPEAGDLRWYFAAALCLVVGTAMLLFAMAASLFTHQTERSPVRAPATSRPRGR